jgi:hypothetical protein
LGFDQVKPSPSPIAFKPIDQKPKAQALQFTQFWAFTVHKPNPNWASQKSKVQFIWTPDESKAQLKWAPATSKDGSDYDPPSPVHNS